MPYPFTLPTTSSFSFSTYFTCDSHPSLPLSASTYRGVLRDALKRHKRLPSNEQSANLSNILQAINNYLPYLLALDDGLGNKLVTGEPVDVVLKTTPELEWRPIISDAAVPGREAARLKIRSLEYEISFALSTLAYTYTLLSRSSLHVLHSAASSSPSAEQRTLAITSASKSLFSAASIHEYLANRADRVPTESPYVDISKSTFRALTFVARAEATLLAVLKDDPYPAVVAQDRNQNDNEWMIKAPDIPKVRAHLFARLCLAAGEHASNAHALLNVATKGQRVNGDLLRYVDDLKRVGRGKACRFFGIDAELGGKAGDALAWLQAGNHELGYTQKEEGKKSFGFGKLKKEWKENREEKKIVKGSNWGADAGKAEEGRVIELLEKKWTKINDTINTQVIPPFGPLLAAIPSGRDVQSVHTYVPPSLGWSILESMRAPPDHTDDYGEQSSDDDVELQEPVGAFPGTKDDYASGSKYY